MLPKEFKRMAAETEVSYLWRLGNAKESNILDLSWNDIAEIMNAEFHEDEPRQESAYRKPFMGAKLFYENGVFSESEYEDFLEMKQELQKERVKIRDERTELNRKLRESAREDSKWEYIDKQITAMSKNRYQALTNTPSNRANNDLIVSLSDLHIGAEFNSVLGSYSPSIATSRLQQYANEIISLQNTFNSENCHIFLLGDLISGNIHKGIQVSNRENVIEQIMSVSMMVSDFTYELSKHFSNVLVYSVAGNHSRISSKNEALHDERLDRLVPWYMKTALSHIKNIQIKDTQIDVSIGIANIRGLDYLLVHGDYDAPTKSAVADLSMVAGFTPYAICSGHLHYPMLKAIGTVKWVQCGSLCGAGDDYTLAHRLTGKASQTVMLCTEDGIKGFFPIELI